MADHDENTPPHDLITLDDDQHPSEDQKPRDKTRLDFPPVLLASYTLPMCTYASYMYSIARVTVFNFQPGVRVSPWVTAATFGVPTALSLGWRLVTLISRDDFHTHDTRLNLDYSLGLRLLLPATIASVFHFSKKLFCEFLLNSWRPFGNARTVGPGIVIPVNAILATYLSDFMLPFFHVYTKGDYAALFVKPMSLLSTGLLDIALTNSFIHLPPYSALVTTISLVSGFFGTYVMTSREHPRFSDTAYDRWVNGTASLSWSQFKELCFWALYTDMCC